MKMRGKCIRPSIHSSHAMRCRCHYSTCLEWNRSAKAEMKSFDDVLAQVLCAAPVNRQLQGQTPLLVPSEGGGSGTSNKRPARPFSPGKRKGKVLRRKCGARNARCRSRGIQDELTDDFCGKVTRVRYCSETRRKVLCSKSFGSSYSTVLYLSVEL